MHISYFTHPGGLLINTGFGYAGFNIVTSLQQLGNKVTFNDHTAEIQLMFSQPPYFEKFDGVNIGYTPWESTEIPKDWYPGFSRCDYFWATSELNKKWYESLGIEVSFVYPHGVSEIWKPRKRNPRPERIKFLHVGEPAPRKSGQMVFDAFIELFSGTQHSLTIKSHGQSTIRATTAMGVEKPTIYDNVTLIDSDFSEAEMISLFQTHDVLVYPSWGEGFGFIPIQAMATGMPVIFNSSWAPYKHYSVGLEVDDEPAESPWPLMHPGEMLRPSYESLKKQMIEVVENYSKYHSDALQKSDSLRKEFSWVRQSAKAMKEFVKVL